MMIAGTVGLLLALAGAYVQGRVDGRRIGDAKAAEYLGAYNLLADRAKQCSAGVYEAEQRALAAAAAGRRARSEAAGAISVARQHADALGRALAAPRVVSECPSGDAVIVVRDDLRSRQPAP